MRPVIAGSEFSIGVKVPRQQLTDAIDGVIGDLGKVNRQHEASSRLHGRPGALSRAS